MKVKDVAKINNQSLTSNFKFNEYKYLDTSSLTKNEIYGIQKYKSKKFLPSRAKRLVQSGDILISTVRPIQCHYGYLECPEENIIVSTGFTVISPDETLVNGRYLYYYLTQEKMTKYFQMVAESAVSSYPSITSDVIGNVILEFPDIEEQKVIANKLKVFDDKMKNNARIISGLEEYSQLLFYKWFIDFNFPDKDGNPYKAFGNKMITFDGKELPENWWYGPLTELGSVVGGGTPSSAEIDYYSNNCIPWLTPKDLSDNPQMYTSRGTRDISESGLKNSSAVLLPKRSILMSSRAPVGYLTIAKNPISTNQGFKSIVPIDERYSEFIYYTLKYNMTKIMLSSSGSTFSEISKAGMERVEVIIPPKDVINLYYEKMKVLFEMIEKLSEEQKLLEETRDILIKQLLV